MLKFPECRIRSLNPAFRKPGPRPRPKPRRKPPPRPNPRHGPRGTGASCGAQLSVCAGLVRSWCLRSGLYEGTSGCGESPRTPGRNCPSVRACGVAVFVVRSVWREFGGMGGVCLGEACVGAGGSGAVAVLWLGPFGWSSGVWGASVYGRPASVRAGLVRSRFLRSGQPAPTSGSSPRGSAVRRQGRQLG